MYSVPFECVTNWIQLANLWLPQSVDIVCPHCGRYVNFALPNWKHDGPSNTALCASNCSGCRKHVRFWAIDPARFGDTIGKECEELCMHPTPALKRQPMSGLEKVPEPVVRAYVSAVNVFNAKEWNATAATCGRALEALVKNVLPQSQAGLALARQLEELPKTLDLAKTLATLTAAIRKGRNLGAHFDLGKEVDAEMAQMMIYLLEYFLEYVYVLPGRVQELHEKL